MFELLLTVSNWLENCQEKGVRKNVGKWFQKQQSWLVQAYLVVKVAGELIEETYQGGVLVGTYGG